MSSGHHQGILEGSMSADNMARQSQGGLGVEQINGIPGTSNPSRVNVATKDSAYGLAIPPG